jgi:hypothetical protein
MRIYRSTPKREKKIKKYKDHFNEAICILHVIFPFLGAIAESEEMSHKTYVAAFMARTSIRHKAVSRVYERIS